MTEAIVEITYECCGTTYHFNYRPMSHFIQQFENVHRLVLGLHAGAANAALSFIDPIHDEQHPECEREEVAAVRKPASSHHAVVSGRVSAA